MVSLLLMSFILMVLQNINLRVFQELMLIIKMLMLSIFVHGKSLHVVFSLHWSEYGVDDLSLWPFAAKHVTWLYNQIPSRTTGLTLIELSTKTHSDH